MMQGLMIHGCTLRSNQSGLVVAHDRKTGTKLWNMGYRMYNNLPTGIGVPVKPPLRSMERGKYMAWGLDSRTLRQAGLEDLDSDLLVDTAKETEAGRGGTYSRLHLSEVAFWDHESKMTSILEGVPDEPDTLVALETTANGANFFKKWWDDAEAGRSEYLAFFMGWWRDPSCWRPFGSDEERAEFIADIGTGPYGEEEPHLMETYGVQPEQLKWRRAKLASPGMSIDLFHQEYPTSAEEAFILSGAHRFNTLYARAYEEEHPPERGELVVAAKGVQRGRLGPVEVPTRIEWLPRRPGRSQSVPMWHLYEQPDPERDYVVFMDPMGGDVDEDTGDLAYHGIEVIDHKSGVQIAEWMSQMDADLAAMEAFKAALYYENAWLAIETTGGYGTAAAKRFYEDFHYPFTYRRQMPGNIGEKKQKKLGWDTNRETKVILEENFEEQLREATDGIRSTRLALQLSTYVRDPETGKTGPAKGTWSDLLMAYMGAQQIARMAPVKVRKKK
jgi:hypothetical protein